MIRMFLYYASHTFVNSIKKIFRSTVLAVIALCMVMGIVVGLTGSMVGKMAPETSYSTENQGGIEEASTEEETEEEEEMTEEEIRTVKTYVEFGLAVGIILFLFLGIKTGMKKGSNIFMMADVNFLFTAPIKPQMVLLFRLSLQMIGILFGSIYILFQIPNLNRVFQLGAAEIAILFAGWFLLLLLQQLVQVLSYLVKASFFKGESFLKAGIYGVTALTAGWIGFQYIQCGRDVLATAEATFGSQQCRWIPVIGWLKGMVMGAFNQQLSESLLYFVFLFVFLSLLFLIICKIKVDFYEDAFEGAEAREQFISDAKEGRKTGIFFGKAKEEDTGKKRLFPKKQRKQKDLKWRGSGAGVFFWKEWEIRKRTALFGVITSTMKFYLALSAGVSLFLWKVADNPDYTIIGGMLLLFVFFRNMGNPIAAETSRNWLFLAPDSAYRKVLAAVGAGTFSCALDILFPLVLSAVVLQASPGIVVLWLLQLVTMDFMLSGIGCMLEVLLPTSALDIVKNMLILTIRICMIAVIVLFIAIGVGIGGIAGGLVVSAFCNLLFGTLLFLVYPHFLHKGIG